MSYSPVPHASSQPRKSKGVCELAEVVQFHCQLQQRRILCQPVERVFRLCARRPTVEVTHLVEYTPTGVPYLRPEVA